ncbi:MAG: arginine--tRNA ligase, partial [Anaerolineales bacterium]|nr:arginine--tRNA ligase [Anaerolineales bacterium]
MKGAHAAQRAGALPDCELPVRANLGRPKRPEWGDYSCALPLQLSKPMKQHPLEIAEQIETHLPESALLGETSVSPPGFVNISLAGDWLAAQVDVVLASGFGYADLQYAAGKKAQVEFVSANPTGPLTVGHGRGGVVGDTIANLLSAVGYQVTREFYYNNAGQQMRRLGESLRRRYLQGLGQLVELEEDHYHGEYLVELGGGILAEHGDGLADAEWEAFKGLAEDAIAAQQRETMNRMRIDMDVFFNERSLYEDGSVDKIVQALREGGFAYESEGALWLAATALGGPQDRVIVKSGGEPTYRLPDIAYHCNKLERGFDLVVDVLGADHKDSFPDVLRGVQALGYDGSGIKILMHQFVTVKGQRMSKRSGRFTTLDELIDEVGADVVRFFMLMRAAESHLDFNLDLAREQSEKNPVYYV